ncbi:MAG TPA: BamA/TamA family outer membrane protein, partial [Bacteroidota bacterium]|nr:BamA/TamA family outer membrane protein [Bacteroidota bacterium]
QFRIGRVLISGNTKTHEKVIRRELYTRPGDFFSRQAIIRSVRQLSQLNYFNPEKIRPDTRITDEKNVDLEYSVEEKSSDTFNMSVGYSGAFGFSGGLGLTFNNFSLSEPLRGGAGQVLNFDWQFGVSYGYRTFTIGFTEPWMFDQPTLFGINFYDTQYTYPYEVHYTGVTTRIGRRLKWPDYLFRVDWSILYQRNLYTLPAGSPYLYPPNPTDTTLSTRQFGITQVFSRNSTDSPLFPSRGSSFSLSTHVSFGPALPSVARYHKHVFSAEWYIPLWNSSRVTFMAASTLGMIFGFDRQSLIPIQDYFRMGGTGLGQFSITPLRGYEEQSVGSRTVRGALIPGKSMIKQSAELRFSLALNPIPIYTLLFAEAGNTWIDHTVQDPLDLKRSAGIGVRLLVNPIGLIGFDYGYGFDDVLPRDGQPDGWKFHFQFGRSF